jgi:hypothetical protein
MIDILSPYVSSDLRYKLKRINVNHLRKFWSDEEIKNLEKEYPEHGTNIKELLENGRTRQSIKSMARDNNIHFIS